MPDCGKAIGGFLKSSEFPVKPFNDVTQTGLGWAK
jgi:hypothetical protein